jgi:hypothetical protein
VNAAGVNRVVIVPPCWEGDHNDLALEAAYLHSDRLAVMGRLPNIAVKATAMPCSVADPFPSLPQHVRRVVDAYGPGVCSGGQTRRDSPAPTARR